MAEQHPITPPAELVHQWLGEFFGCTVTGELSDSERYLATQAARWGADQELEACCKNMKSIPSPLGVPFGEMASNALRAARRPQPPSLAEQALLAIDTAVAEYRIFPEVALVVRAALEQLQELEKGND